MHLLNLFLPSVDKYRMVYCFPFSIYLTSYSHIGNTYIVSKGQVLVKMLYLGKKEVM